LVRKNNTIVHQRIQLNPSAAGDTTTKTGNLSIESASTTYAISRETTAIFMVTNGRWKVTLDGLNKRS
jgi:hypothetical protein